MTSLAATAWVQIYEKTVHDITTPPAATQVPDFLLRPRTPLPRPPTHLLRATSTACNNRGWRGDGNQNNGLMEQRWSTVLWWSTARPAVALVPQEQMWTDAKIRHPPPPLPQQVSPPPPTSHIWASFGWGEGRTAFRCRPSLPRRASLSAPDCKWAAAGAAVSGGRANVSHGQVSVCV